MNPWHYYFYLRRVCGYAPHMAYLCAAMNACDAGEFHRRLELVARWLNK